VDFRAGQLPLQAVQRGVVGELGRDDVSQQPWAAQAAGDRPHFGRAGGLETLLHRHRSRVAVLAGIGLADGAAHEETCRLQVQLFGLLRANADARLATTRAELFRFRQVKNDVAAFEVLG
jgi:hypothetical protein